MTFDSSEKRELAGRRLRYSLAASLLIHVLVLWPDATQVLTKDAPSILHATLKTPLPPAAPPVPTKPPPRAVAPAPTVRAAAPVARQPLLEQDSPVSVPPAVADSVPRPLVATDAAPVAAIAPSAAVAGTGGAVALTEASATGEAIDGLRGYKLAVAAQAKRFKRYPAQAMASGWEGRAEIRVDVGSDGRPRPAVVFRSSGHEALDKAALTMIDAGALRARLPESLRGKAFSVVLPVVFNLSDG